MPVRSPKPSPSPTAAPTPVPDPFEAARRLEVSTPEEAASRLADAEARIPPATVEGARDLGIVQQAAYRQLVARPEWREPAISAIPSELRTIVRDNVEAGAALRELTEPRDVLPGWRIVVPPPADDLRRHYAEAESSSGVSWTFLAAIHLVESRMGRIRGTSSAGAEGPMQFLPSTWARYGRGDINDPRDAILAAARLLVANGAPRDLPKALYRYNPSRHYVRAVTLYAGHMERSYRAYYHWQVYVRTTRGDALLAEGWPY